MKRYSKLFVLLLLFVLCPKNVNALLCENADKVKFQEMAKNISYTYDAKEVDGRDVFTLTFTSVNPNLKLKNDSTGQYYYQHDGEIVITGLMPNVNYRYEVYVNDGSGCEDINMYIFNVILPYYNRFHNDPLCEGIETYELCKKWTRMSHTYNDWKVKVEKYRESLIKEEEEKKVEHKKTSLAERIIDAYGRVYYLILPVVILGGIIGIYIYNKKRELF